MTGLSRLLIYNVFETRGGDSFIQLIVLDYWIRILRTMLNLLVSP